MNTVLVDLYWQLGEYISRKLETATWGEGVVDALALYIHAVIPISGDLPGGTCSGWASSSTLIRVSKKCHLFVTLAVPKAEELVTTSYRHGSKEKAKAFFLDGMTQAMCRLAQQTHPAFPVTFYYAFKQAENDGKDGTGSTGWDTFLDAVIHAGFAISGSWPMRTVRGLGR